MAKKKIGYNHHLSLNNLLILIRTMCVIGAVTALLMVVAFAVRSTNAIKEIHTDDIVELENNSKVVGYISTINHMDNTDTISLIKQSRNPLVLSGIFVIFPTCLFFIGLFFAFYSLIIIFNFTAGVRARKDILTRKKYNMLQNARTLAYISMLLLFIMFGISFFYIGLIIIVLFEFGLYMFDSLVDLEEKQTKKD